MKELSIFVDESGDFGEYNHHSPYYIITMVFHNQNDDISEDINKFNDIKKRKDIEIYKIAAFAMISSIVLVIVMVHLYNLNLQ